jgi:hypothetical protein
MKPRRIWVTVAKDTYNRFRKKCKKRGYLVPDTFRRLVVAWTDGEVELPEDREQSS